MTCDDCGSILAVRSELLEVKTDIKLLIRLISALFTGNREFEVPRPVLPAIPPTSILTEPSEQEEDERADPLGSDGLGLGYDHNSCATTDDVVVKTESTEADDSPELVQPDVALGVNFIASNAVYNGADGNLSSSSGFTFASHSGAVIYEEYGHLDTSTPTADSSLLCKLDALEACSSRPYAAPGVSSTKRVSVSNCNSFRNSNLKTKLQSFAPLLVASHTPRESDQKRFARRRRRHVAKEHVCGACGEILQSRRALLLHQRRHDGRERPFQCDACGFRFLSASDLKGHRESVHEGVSWACGQCYKQFNRKSNLLRHELGVHKKISE